MEAAGIEPATWNFWRVRSILVERRTRATYVPREGQARTTMTRRHAGVSAGVALVRSAMGGW